MLEHARACENENANKSRGHGPKTSSCKMRDGTVLSFPMTPKPWKAKGQMNGKRRASDEEAVVSLVERLAEANGVGSEPPAPDPHDLLPLNDSDEAAAALLGLAGMAGLAAGGAGGAAPAGE